MHRTGAGPITLALVGLCNVHAGCMSGELPRERGREALEPELGLFSDGNTLPSDDGGVADAPSAPTSLWPAARDPHVNAKHFPPWAFTMRIWPFDILEPGMSNADIDSRIKVAQQMKATVLMFYIESEHMFGSFVDDKGFQNALTSIKYLAAKAGQAGLKTMVYLNALEVMTRGAYDGKCQPIKGVETMASRHPSWLQTDMSGVPIVFKCQNEAWLEPDWEDAWVSPFSGYRQLFQQRIAQLASAKVDAVYLDAAFLPGYQADEDNRRWGSSDPGFAAAFLKQTGFSIPKTTDLGAASFRAFLGFRHAAIADYLGDLAKAASQSGLAAFWESSANDTVEGTLLGNETAVTGRRGLGFSPEVEPEGDWVAAFRMAKAARELNQERPMIYLSWPTDKKSAAMHFAVAIAHSNNYYPTADQPIPGGAFALLEDISWILARRVAYHGDTALVYSVRNKDYTYTSESAFDAYDGAFQQLLRAHLPFRITPLEYLGQGSLNGVKTAVLPGLIGISDSEAALLAAREVVKLGSGVGTRDESWKVREQPLTFKEGGEISDLTARLPFTVQAPEETMIEFYGDVDGDHVMYLFAVSPEPKGEIVIRALEGVPIEAKAYRLQGAVRQVKGPEIKLKNDSPLTVIVVKEHLGDS